MNNKERRIKEQRLIEAAEKNILGASGKLGTICKYLGDPIKRVGGIFYESYEDDVSWGEEDADELPTEDLDTLVSVIGFLFDGLSRGMHLEVKYLSHEKKLTCHYKGYEVYKEVEGNLLAYAPFPEWESLIDKLYKNAQTASNKKKRFIAEEEKVEKTKKAISFLQKLRIRWGI